MAGCFVFVSLVNAENSYSPYADQTYPTSVYWGDTHVHTNLSGDAYPEGNKTLSPDDAYRFARGDIVNASNGMKVKLQKPLDFLVVADHSDGLGIVRDIEGASKVLQKTEIGRRHVARYQELKASLDATQSPIKAFVSEWQDDADAVNDEDYRQSIWQEVTSAADGYNEPKKFTAFIGFEWSANRPFPGNLHRVVIFKDDATKANQVLPYSSRDSHNPKDLWRYLERYEQKTGGNILAIPHNANLSNGRMFGLIDRDGQPLSRLYAETRSRWEPLLEVSQVKGDSETHPLLSPKDEFADFETWHAWTGKNLTETSYEAKYPGYLNSVMTLEKKQHEYSRSALKLGLKQQAKLGVNPFKFGMIGSTDSHTSLSTADDNNFWGKMAFGEPSATRMLDKDSYLPVKGWEFSSSGYAAVWAEENTREALFAAMKRKETYATTGPRMTVRFFGGWEYEQNDALKSGLAKIGYNKGVPMGGDLTNAPKDKTPSFLIRAVKDPDGANLDRVQVIKGWHDSNGELHEKIYNVALSDGRKENWRGKVKPVGNTVDVENAAYTNSIGDPELAVVWTDPDFDKDQLAFYYVRVLEIPTPRWTAYDAKYFGLKNIPEEVPMITQERAYTSPIWYSPTTPSM